MHVHAAILALCETRVFLPDSKYDIPGFSVFFADKEISKHGMAIYACTDHSSVVSSAASWSWHELELVITKLNNINLCVVYFPPKQATLQNFKTLLEKISPNVSLYSPTILSGDFNQDSSQSSSVANYLKINFQYTSLLNSTTDYGSCSDHIYIYFPKNSLHSWGSLESYYSDHIPIYISVDLSFYFAFITGHTYISNEINYRYFIENIFICQIWHLHLHCE